MLPMHRNEVMFDSKKQPIPTRADSIKEEEMTQMASTAGFTTVGVEYRGSSPYSFGVPLTGPREHPLEPSTTAAFPLFPITVLNDAIPVTRFGP